MCTQHPETQHVASISFKHTHTDTARSETRFTKCVTQLSQRIESPSFILFSFLFISRGSHIYIYIQGRNNNTTRDSNTLTSLCSPHTQGVCSCFKQSLFLRSLAEGVRALYQAATEQPGRLSRTDPIRLCRVTSAGSATSFCFRSLSLSNSPLPRPLPGNETRSFRKRYLLKSAGSERSFPCGQAEKWRPD